MATKISTSQRMRALSGVAGVLAVAVAAVPAGAATSDPELVSVARAGASANASSQNPDVSPDGRYVAFQSFASDLVARDTNGAFDVFVRDRKIGRTTRVSVSSTGRQGNGGSIEPSISANGRFVAFASDASNLVRGDTNGTTDIFIHDRLTGTTARVNVSSRGRQANGESGGAIVSASGSYVAFTSEATNLVARDTNRATDVFLRDRTTGRTTRVNVSAREREAQGETITVTPALSASGRFVAFDSTASNLVRGDTNREVDVFLRDRRTGTTKRVSVTSAGGQANGDSFNAALSADGRVVSFNSLATNLVGRGDTNGVMDVFVRDRARGRTVRVNVDSTGNQAVGRRDPEDPGTYGDSGDADISGNGRFVTFYSTALNLVAGDGNAAPDVFIRDRLTRTTTRASVATGGGEAAGWSVTPEISADGRFVAFLSDAEILVPEDGNGSADVFVQPRSCP